MENEIKKIWIEHRVDELRIKSRVKELDEIEYPDRDIDGSYFCIEWNEEQENRFYDLLASYSKRLQHLHDRFLYDHQHDYLESYK